MRIITIVFSFIFSAFQLCAQSDSINNSRDQYLYFEIGGPSTILSINYEIQLFHFNKFHLNGKAGLGATRVKDFNLKINPDFTLPIGLNSTFSILKREKGTLKIELMAGNTFSSFVRVNNQYIAQREFDNHGFISIGPSWTFTKRLYTRLNYSLILDKYETPFHWGGLSIGYKIK